MPLLGPLSEVNGDGCCDRSPKSSTNGDSMSVEIPMPIAVVGMACRFPGDDSSVKGLWDMCCEGRSAWSEIPKERLNVEKFWHPDPARKGCFNARGGHFIKQDVGLFDAPFFGISPNEAKSMDPQQRFLLETVYEALENGGIPLDKIVGQDVGVYVGVPTSDYSDFYHRDPPQAPIYRATGTAHSIAANRISYLFDLKGPSVAIDTACSSSLMALHLACQSLKAGESRHAIVGGAHILLSPETMLGLSALRYVPDKDYVDLSRLQASRLFSEEGKCYTYDNRGTGYGRGEGVASLILKPLKDAVAAGDHIHTIIRNTGANQDGKTAGITYPSQDSQARLIQSVYNAARLDPSDTHYVEAHGTGTAAGDPVEAGAIARAMTAERNADHPLIVGSVKTNIGHLEACSGLAGFIKASMVLKTGIIPPNLNYEVPNDQIPLHDFKLKVPTCTIAWPTPGVRRASLNSFGFGGANVHVILEKFSPPQGDYRHHDTNSADGSAQGDTTLSSSAARKRLYVLSASDQTSAKSQITDLASYLRKVPETDVATLMPQLAFTLSQRRSLFDWRVAVPALSIKDLLTSLEAGELKPTKALAKPRIGFVFTGQGSQWHAMGRELMEDYPVFANTLKEADRCLIEMGAGWSLLDELRKDPESTLINEAYVSQPATTALQIGLVSLLSSWNIKPDAVTGHSSGEIAAAFAAGALSIEQSMSIAFHRGLLASTINQRCPGRRGAMMAIGASAADVQKMLSQITSGKAIVACINSPKLITTSGDERAIDELSKIAENHGLLARKLRVDVAYHSQHMDTIAVDYLKAIEHITPNLKQRAGFYSSVKSQRMTLNELGPRYWVENMTSPVQFSRAIEELCSHTHGSPIAALIEIGPHSALEAPIKDILKAHSSWGSKPRYLSSLVRRRNATSTLLHLVADLFCLGSLMDLSAINSLEERPTPKLIVDLPSYPWMHTKRHWDESRLSRNFRRGQFPRNDILGVLVDDFNEMEPRWRNILRTSEMPWLLHHQVQSSIVFPLTGYLSLVIEAAFQRAVSRGIAITRTSRYDFREISVNRSLILTESSEVETSIVLRPHTEGTRSSSEIWDRFAIYSWAEDQGWAQHCQGLVTVRGTDGTLNVIDGERHDQARRSFLSEMTKQEEIACTNTVDCKKLYRNFAEAGLDFGPTFQNVSEARARYHHCVCTVKIPNTANLMPYNHQTDLIVHPATLDACLHSIPIALRGGSPDSSTLHVPTFIGGLSIVHGISSTPGNLLRIFATAKADPAEKSVHASLIVFDNAENDQMPAIELSGFIGTMLPRDSGNEPSRDRLLCQQMHWEPHIDTLLSTQYEAAIFKSPDYAGIDTYTMAMDRAAFYHIREILKSVRDLDFEDVRPHHKRLYTVLEKYLKKGEQGILVGQTEEWLQCSEESARQFVNDLRSSNDCAEVVALMAENVPAVFRQEIEPLSIMVPNNLLERFYQGYEALDYTYLNTESFTDKLAHENPRLRILEIGSGTGSTTAHLLKTLGGSDGNLPRFSNYHYTDISAGFFEKAKDQFKGWGDLITYKTLNIEDDPSAQGFEPESYDLIVAAHVLHITPDMTQTMRNVRMLLKPGGKLVFAETTRVALVTTVFFGTLPGWWAGQEAEREDGPMLDQQQWDALLRKTGFSGIDGSQSDTLQTGAVMISTAVTNEDVDYPSPIIVGESTSDMPLEFIKNSLRNLTGRVPHWSPLSQIESLNQMEPAEKYYVFLELDQPFWRHLSAAQLKQMQSLFSTAKGILWVTRGAHLESPDVNMSTGVARCIRSENSNIKYVTLDLDQRRIVFDADTAETITSVFKFSFASNALRSDCDMEFAERGGHLEIPRVLFDRPKDIFIVGETQPPILETQPYSQKGRSLKLDVATPGLLESIYFHDNKVLKNSLGDYEVEIAIGATGMNFRDIMTALGQIPYDDVGVECSGTISAVGDKVLDLLVGDRVCAVVDGCYANSCHAAASVVTKIPQEMSFAVAASIPVVFCTAYQALINVGRLIEGESVLIHGAAGGVGQAAIMLCQMVGADTYVTVGSIEKKEFIMQAYHIPEDHIFSSRDSTFAPGIMRATGGKGVDVVLNSVAGEALRLTWSCMAPLGRFLEIGKRDLVQNTGLEMEKFLKSVTFASVDLGTLAKYKPYEYQRVCSVVMELHQSGALHPVSPITTYSMSEIQKALRLMQSGKHMGKIVIVPQSDDQVQAVPAPLSTPVAQPDVTYLITGGTGGVGRSLTRWLAGQGAKHILLASRSGLQSQDAQTLVEELEVLGVQIIVKRCDISSESQVKDLIKHCEMTMPTIRGVIHGAMVLDDILFENLSINDYRKVVFPRVVGAWNLHNALLSTPLDFFVMLGSASGIAGNLGQAAYCASNTFMDAFASYRASLSLPASTIDLGLVADVGYVATSSEERSNIIGTVIQDRIQVKELEALVKGAILRPIVKDGLKDWRQTITGFKLEPGKPLPFWAVAAKFSHLVHAQEITAALSGRGSSNGSSSGAGVSVRTLLRTATSLPAAIDMILQATLSKLGTLTMTPQEELDVAKPLAAFGLDSLVAVELRNWIGREMDANVPLLELMQAVTLKDLAEVITGKSRLVGFKGEVENGEKKADKH
ncbi:MAG: Type I Iterative PKS [Pycnora praestabilis]|nr:MAG: Type I Iterative PKS [Pycnora praestabilis]